MPILDMTTGNIVTTEDGNIAYSDDDLTPEQRAWFEDRLDTEWDANRQYFGNIYVPIKTKTVNVEPDNQILFH